MKKVLLISFMAMTFLVPFYCMAAEPGCGYTDTETGFGGENAKLILNGKKMQSDRWMHQADILIEFLDWENPGRDRIRYFAASTARPIPLNDPNEMVKVQHISVRVSVKNKSTRLRRIWVRLRGTLAGAYQDMCRQV